MTSSPDRSEFYKLVAEVLPVLLVALVAFDFGVDERLRRQAKMGRRGAYLSLSVWSIYLVAGIIGEGAALSVVYWPSGMVLPLRHLVPVLSLACVAAALLLLTVARWYAVIKGTRLANREHDRDDDHRHKNCRRDGLEGKETASGIRVGAHAWRLSITWEKPHGG